ncbi:MAG: WXG100 family type VII secretion target [Ruminococcaceae bacterium]|nr:WXG100 family type VII secretion target [Oscillospiraceae bacterium]
MAIEGINISLDEVSATASSISTKNGQLTEKLDEISQKMAALSSTWQSEGAEVIRSKMEGMKPTFENYRQIIDSYVKFLNDTVSNYTATETQIKNSASSFQ